MKIRYTPRALEELDRISAYIAEQSPSGAARVRKRLEDTISKLALFPFSGVQTSIEDLRRVTVTPHPYAVFYQVMNGEVVVIAVRHTARIPLSRSGNA